MTVTQLISKVRSVYSLPQTFHRLQEVVQNPNSSMSDIGEVLMSDQALSARILQLANCSFYGFPSRIETVSHAVTMIGAEQMVALVQGTCVASIFTNGVGTCAPSQSTPTCRASANGVAPANTA